MIIETVYISILFYIKMISHIINDCLTPDVK